MRVGVYLPCYCSLLLLLFRKYCYYASEMYIIYNILISEYHFFAYFHSVIVNWKQGDEKGKSCIWMRDRSQRLKGKSVTRIAISTSYWITKKAGK